MRPEQDRMPCPLSAMLPVPDRQDSAAGRRQVCRYVCRPQRNDGPARKRAAGFGLPLRYTFPSQKVGPHCPSCLKRYGKCACRQPRHGGEDEHILIRRTRNVLLLRIRLCFCPLHIGFHAVRHVDTDEFEQFRVRIKPGEGGVDAFQQRRLPFDEAVAEFFQPFGTAGDGVDERQREGEPTAAHEGQKMGDVQLEGDAVLRFQRMAEDPAVFGSFPALHVHELKGRHSVAPFWVSFLLPPFF